MEPATPFAIPILFGLWGAGLQMTGSKFAGIGIMAVSEVSMWWLLQPTSSFILWGGWGSIILLHAIYGLWVGGLFPFHRIQKKEQGKHPLPPGLALSLETHPSFHKETSTTIRPQERTVDDTLQEVLTGKYSGRTVGDELADLQRQKHYLWMKLKEAAPKDKPALIRKLEQTLRQQLQLGADLHLFNQDKEQFDKIVKELKDLRNVEKTLKL